MAEKKDTYKRNLIAKDLAFALLLNSAINIFKKILVPFMDSFASPDNGSKICRQGQYSFRASELPQKIL